MKKVKLQKPSWTRDNSVKTLREIHAWNREFATERSNANGDIGRFLKRNGWEYREAYNVENHGYTLCFWKENVLPQNRPIYFDWYWKNNGGDDFFVGNLHGYYDLHQDDKFWHPGVQIEIDPILPRFLEDLPKYEKRLVATVNLQLTNI